MAIEYERRFLVDINSERLIDLLPHIAEKKHIEQGYLQKSENLTLRIRKTQYDSAYLTLKGPKIDGACDEFEFRVDYESADKLMSMCSSKVEKTRYIIMIESLRWELDVFKGPLEGLVIVEIEGDKDTLTEQLDKLGYLPSWIGREITDDGFFSNASLSTKTWATVKSYIEELK